jgi:uncharacterized damage-inducible protein DinB
MDFLLKEIPSVELGGRMNFRSWSENMDFPQLFLQRHAVLYDFYLESFWKVISEDLMRQRPHPGVNSIAWILWHMTRVEDSGLNRFVADRPQVLDDEPWMQRMNAPWRHNGGGMNFEEVDALSQRVDLPALHEYSRAVQRRTHEIVDQIDQVDLGETLQAERASKILIDEGLGHSNAADLAKWYTGWSKGRSLMTFGLTHPNQHVGEMGVIASLLGVVFE